MNSTSFNEFNRVQLNYEVVSVIFNLLGFLWISQISRTQLELVKNIKHSGDGIQSKLLTRVLGDIENFHIQPYDSFLDEEKNRLHKHWSVIALFLCFYKLKLKI